ncbi:unnamed protein product [Cyprideis torosa]|uniref:Uncharacterized protein n=1 Tax=Cyprideis torosa TaxID=163714 RepID=A0A7R8ZKT4_9CRUS|nr:unnamed protein product [Cyprideis torosa]CAG0880901.1 unnamed protein product [Cyprideis torosa]
MRVHSNRDLKTEWSSPLVPIRSPPSSPLRSPKREVDPLDDAFLTKIKKEPEDEKIDTAQQSSSWSGQPSSPAKDYEQLHPRKRKLRNRESTLCSPPSAAGASPSQDAPSYNGTAGEGSTTEEAVSSRAKPYALSSRGSSPTEGGEGGGKHRGANGSGSDQNNEGKGSGSDATSGNVTSTDGIKK